MCCPVTCWCCAETTLTTTHDDPTFVEEEIVHCCVANMPGAFSRTATQALNNATMTYALKIANLGIEQALAQVQELRPGLNTYQGKLTYEAVAEAHGLPYSAYSV